MKRKKIKKTTSPNKQLHKLNLMMNYYVQLVLKKNSPQLNPNDIIFIFDG